MSKVRVRLVGVGNCAAGLVQAIEIAKTRKSKDDDFAATHPMIGEYDVEDISFASAFDVGSNKIGKPLGKAIYESPNLVRWKETVSDCDIEVMPSPILDGVSYLVDQKVNPYENNLSIEKLRESIIEQLKLTRTDLIVNYLPVGSQNATEFWADAAIEAGCGMINAIPVFIASDEKWEDVFHQKTFPSSVTT